MGYVSFREIGDLCNSYPYVVLRKQTYYFRMRLPAHLRLLLPSLPAEFKRSLSTDSLKEAVALVAKKVPLIRLLRNCHDVEQIRELCRKLFDFTAEMVSRVREKLKWFNSESEIVCQ